MKGLNKAFFEKPRGANYVGGRKIPESSKIPKQKTGRESGTKIRIPAGHHIAKKEVTPFLSRLAHLSFDIDKANQVD